jgi:hypothetical protein
MRLGTTDLNLIQVIIYEIKVTQKIISHHQKGNELISSSEKLYNKI